MAATFADDVIDIAPKVSHTDTFKSTHTTPHIHQNLQVIGISYSYCYKHSGVIARLDRPIYLVHQVTDKLGFDRYSRAVVMVISSRCN